jgi:hypothetical protein
MKNEKKTKLGPMIIWDGFTLTPWVFIFVRIGFMRKTGAVAVMTCQKA